MGDERNDEEPRRFARPWEQPTLPAEDEANDVDADGIDDVEVDTAPEGLPEDPERVEGADDAMELFGAGPSSLDDYTHDDYVAATTAEYRGLAEDVARANTETFERQAVAAAFPGVGSGLIGFEDVTGQKGLSEEDVEHEEQQRASDLTLRIGSAVVLLGLFLGSLLMGGVWFAAFATLVMVLSLSEFYVTLRSRGYAPAALFGFIGLLGASIGAHVVGPVAIGAFAAVTVLLVALFYSLAPRRMPLENASLTVLGAVWVSMLAFAIAIGRSTEALGLILLVVLVTAIFDIGAYFVGRAFGRRLLAPKVSPKKTVEGLIGGVVAAVASAIILSTFPLVEPQLSILSAVVLALVVCVLAPLGDAAESVIKRALDVKDMGSLLPGHGGMLDRVDALLFVAPGAYLLFAQLGYL